MDLVWMAQRHVDAEYHIAADRAENPGIGDRSQHEAERAGNPAGKEHRRFVGDQGADAWPADEQLAVLVALRSILVEQFVLDDGDPRIVLTRRTCNGHRLAKNSDAAAVSGVSRTSRIA